MASSSLSFKEVVAELVQLKVNYCFSGNVSHSCIRGSVQMFDNDVIRHELNGTGVAGDCTTRCNFQRLCLDISYESTHVI